MASGKPGGPDQDEDVTAEVTLSRRKVGYSAHIEYRDGTSENLPLDYTNLQGAKGRATHHMTKHGYAGVSTVWRTAKDGTATRLFRRTPGTS